MIDLDAAWVNHHGQIIVVTTPTWNTLQGSLRCYEKCGSKWVPVGQEVPVVVGKNGMGWGQGLYPWTQEGPQKREGDKRSPAGVFRLKTAFGIAPKANIKLPYVPIQTTTEAIDDPNSIYYNRIVDSDEVRQKDWKSSEKMIECLPYYNLGIVVEYNTDPITPGSGSCIFMHVWRSKNEGTGGCTAMAEDDLAKILEWLDPAADPILIQNVFYDARREDAY